MMKISASKQVVGWLAGPPPQTKHRVRLSLRLLASGKGDNKAHPDYGGAIEVTATNQEYE